uniref:Uncharacterized protein n=1 Tax=Arundo donax TaxID=35708 RepID=A0A0A9DJR2_ARUDO
MDRDWEMLFPLTTLKKIPRYMSDHNPMIIETKQQKKRSSKPFCFELSWLQHPDFLPKVKEIWEKPIKSNSSISTWIIKIRRVKKYLKGWGDNNKGVIKKSEKKVTR